MKHLPPLAIAALLALLFVLPAASQDGGRVRVQQETDPQTQEVFVRHEFVVKAPRDRVWRAFTTAEGWMMWVCPLAEVELRVGGTIRTNYNAEGAIGDETTNTLHIVNYVPRRLLTLQAEVRKNFLELTEEDQRRLYNVVEFHAVSDSETRVISHGIGYLDTPRHRKVLGFFLGANTKLYEALIRKLEADSE